MIAKNQAIAFRCFGLCYFGLWLCADRPQNKSGDYRVQVRGLSRASIASLISIAGLVLVSVSYLQKSPQEEKPLNIHEHKEQGCCFLLNWFELFEFAASSRQTPE